MGLAPSQELLQEVVAETSFEAMKKKEDSIEVSKAAKEKPALLNGLRPFQGSDEEREKSGAKVRSGTVAGYTKYLSPEDVDFCNSMMEKYLHPILADIYLRNKTYAFVSTIDTSGTSPLLLLFAAAVLPTAPSR